MGSHALDTPWEWDEYVFNLCINWEAHDLYPGLSDERESKGRVVWPLEPLIPSSVVIAW